MGVFSYSNKQRHSKSGVKDYNQLNPSGPSKTALVVANGSVSKCLHRNRRSVECHSQMTQYILGTKNLEEIHAIKKTRQNYTQVHERRTSSYF